MNKEFDFDDIGKKTPYRTPDNFFEDMQQKVMERTCGGQRRKHRLQIMETIYSSTMMQEQLHLHC